MPHRHKRLEKAVITVFVAIMPLLFTVDSGASGDEPPRLEADCSVEIIGEPEINEPFEVVFTFTPNHDMIHTKGIPDTAKIRVGRGINFVSGDILWTGFLEKGETYILRAWLMVSDSIKFRVKGKVIAMQAMGLFMSVHDIPDPGVKARDGASSRIINLAGIPENVIIVNKPIINPEDSTVLYFVKDTIPKPHFWEPVFVQPPLENGLRQKNTVKKTRTREPNRRPSPEDNIIKIDSAGLYRGDTIIIKKNWPNIIIPELKGKFRILDKKSFDLDNISNDVFQITPIDFDTLLQIEYLDTIFTIPVDYQSIYYIQGNASFVDNNNVIQDCEYKNRHHRHKCNNRLSPELRICRVSHSSRFRDFFRNPTYR